MPVKTARRNKIANRLPSHKDIAATFAFIDNTILRENMVLTLQHIYFIVVVADEVGLEKTAYANGLYKDMTLHCAAIIEGCLHYCLKFYFDNNLEKSSRVMSSYWDSKGDVTIHKISSKKLVCGVIKRKKFEKLTKFTNFSNVHRACLKAGILTKELEKQVHRIREERNHIHLAGLRLVDNTYTKRDAQRAVTLMTKIVRRVEKMAVKKEA